MTCNLILTGDVNLVNVDDPAVPFRKVSTEFNAADLVFSNLECCLYLPPHGVSVDDARLNEGFFADPVAGGEALCLAGIQAVGIANNVNYGAEAITASIARLDELGVAHTGAGQSAEAARAPIVLERGGLRIGIMQRTAIYWATNHEASPSTPGVAATKCHTAYQLPFSRLRPDMQEANRPGLPPLILTWVDPAYLKDFERDVATLRETVDLLVVSCHWGLRREVQDYMPQLGRAAIDAGADIVMGHGPHYALPVEMYKGKPIFYGLGSFSFNTGRGGRKHGNWVGICAHIRVEGKAVDEVSFRFVRHNDANETELCDLGNEQDTLDDLRTRSAELNASLTPCGNGVLVTAA